MSEHKKLVQELQDCRFTFGAGVALKPRDKVNRFDHLMLDSLEKAIAALRGSTEEKVCISRECAENSITALQELHEITEWDCTIPLNELEAALQEKEQ